MTTYVRAAEAARRLGVTPATLYAYVSRGRIARRRAADGRTSLFAVDDIDALLAASGRPERTIRPSIDVHIASAITRLGDDGIVLRGHDLATLVDERRFEDVAELLMTGELPRRPAVWPAPDPGDLDAVNTVADAAAAMSPVSRIAVAALTIGARHPDDDAAAATRRLLRVLPAMFGASQLSGRYAARLASAWSERPGRALVEAIDTSLMLLADHELATSTLAVRIAASVRAAPLTSIATGLTSLDSPLHGSAARLVHDLIEQSAAIGPTAALSECRVADRHVPGFGHKVYRDADPRFAPLYDRVRAIDRRRMATVDDLLATVSRSVSARPNVDFALGALTWTAGLDRDIPIFAVARLAGWAAHYDEEITEPPLRYRALASPR
jgi:citrate synthase